jgi:hypothetical protein
MIVCKQFAFVHMPKTGGTWVRDTLKEHPHPSWNLREMPGHHPVRVAPGVPSLGAIRNPWDWYVSTYFFRRQHILNGTGAWAKPRDQWSGGMVAWAKLTRELPPGREGFLKGLRIMMRHDPLVPGQAGEGSFTTRYIDFLCVRGEVLCEIAKFESLRSDVERFLHRHKIPVTPALVAALRSAPKKNTSKRGPYQQYYDDAGRDLVAEADRAIIERYGYEF